MKMKVPELSVHILSATKNYFFKTKIIHNSKPRSQKKKTDKIKHDDQPALGKSKTKNEMQNSQQNYNNNID